MVSKSIGSVGLSVLLLSFAVNAPAIGDSSEFEQRVDAAVKKYFNGREVHENQFERLKDAVARFKTSCSRRTETEVGEDYFHLDYFFDLECPLEDVDYAGIGGGGFYLRAITKQSNKNFWNRIRRQRTINRQPVPLGLGESAAALQYFDAIQKNLDSLGVWVFTTSSGIYLTGTKEEALKPILENRRDRVSKLKKKLETEPVSPEDLEAYENWIWEIERDIEEIEDLI